MIIHDYMFDPPTDYDEDIVPHMPSNINDLTNQQRASSQINETKMLPVTLTTDITTASEVLLLLEMIRYCMEKSGEGTGGENKEFNINLHIKNRSNLSFMVGVGDESLPPIASEQDVYIGH